MQRKILKNAESSKNHKNSKKLAKFKNMQKKSNNMWKFPKNAEKLNKKNSKNIEIPIVIKIQKTWRNCQNLKISLSIAKYGF